MSYSRVAHSKTKTSGARPSGRQQHMDGRPYQARRPPPNRHHYPAQEMDQSLETSPAPATASTTAASERSLESHGAHYMLTPHSSKNSKLKSIAKREEEEYREHKDRKRERVTEMLHQQRPAVVGGISKRQEELRQLREEQEKRQKVEARFAAVRQREKREQYRREQRQKEEEEIEQRKQVQREKANRLKEKQAAEHKMEVEEMKRKRLAKFDTN